MTQIATVQQPAILTGPRGIKARETGGSYSDGCQLDIKDGAVFCAPLILLTGTTDAIPGQVHYNAIITAGAIDAVTLPLPRVGLDDGLNVAIFSDTLFAHTVTLPSAKFANGAAALATIATFAAFRGAGLRLRAYNGTWQVISSPGITFS